MKLSCYKIIGFSFLKFKKYEIAQKYFIKVLKLAWYLNDKYNEIHAYDRIGLCLY